MIAIVDYSMGNLRSVSRALEHVSKDRVIVTSDPGDILRADRVVFPGQGAARDCMKELEKHKLIEVIREAASAKPFLGICMGMQVLMDFSEENEGTDCLSFYKGQVKAFKGAMDISKEGVKIPQMGWNRIKHTTDHPLWNGIADESRFYFVHSYFVAPENKSLITGETKYGITYASAIAKNNIFAIQAHPEKSADDGLQLLKNFTEWDGSL